MSASETTMLAVVSSVAIPPSAVANAIGNMTFEGINLRRFTASIAPGSSTAAAAMLFMNSERNAPLPITSAIMLRSPPRLTWLKIARMRA